MSQKLAEVPEQYRYLLPETVKRTIIIGSEAYEILPLTEGEYEALWSEIGELFGQAAAAIASALTAPPDGKGKRKLANMAKADPIAVGITTVKETLQTMLSSGQVASIVGIAVQQDAELIRKNLTLKQGVHILSVLYEQNFDMADLPEGIRKNLEGFLAVFGINLAKGPNPTQEMLDITLETLADLEDHKTSSQEALETIRKEALKRGFRIPSSAGESMKPSPGTTDGPENTSKEPSSGNVTSPVNDAGEDTGQDSVKDTGVEEPQATPTPENVSTG